VGLGYGHGLESWEIRQQQCLARKLGNSPESCCNADSEFLDYKSTSCTAQCAHASHQRKSKRAEGQIVFVLPTLKGLGQEIEFKYLNDKEHFQ
jgi:hypothetical protein